jgi:hypothetical protein
MEGEWSFLKEFAWNESVEPMTWDHAITFSEALDSLEAPLRERLRVVLGRWDDRLSEFGGDPLREDWRRFRPLRRGREEDWSDWLAWLLQTSRSGHFAARLFGREATACCGPKVDRELPVDQHRLDLRISWPKDGMTTVEVKIGDQDFEKTERAAEAHCRSNPGTQCTDWILMPREDLDTWHTLAPSRVRPICWDEVAKQLRACLVSNAETESWRVWGRSFAGSIEQDLLGYPQVKDVSDIGDLPRLLKHLEESDGE